MNLDTRASRAADGVRASTIGLDPMTALSDLKQESTNRRRARAAGLAGTLAVVLALCAWFAVVQRPGGAHPVTPRPAGTPIGARLLPAVSATVPSGWTAKADTDYLWLEDPATGVTFEVSKPIISAIDPSSGKPVAAPHDYRAWLRSHPWVVVDADRVVSVDGIQTHEMTYHLRPYTGDFWHPHAYDLVSDLGTTLAAFSGLDPGTPITDVIIPLRHEVSGDPFASGYRLLRRNGGVNGTAAQSAFDAGVAQFLASLRLP